MHINVEKLKSCAGSMQTVSIKEQVAAGDYGYQGVLLSAPIIFQGFVKNEKSVLRKSFSIFP